MKSLSFSRAALVVGFCLVGSMVWSGSAEAQNPVNTRIQLPVISFFNIRTAVMVPDGGTMSLGGVSRHAEGSISRGVPGIGGPLSRPFSNRGTGFSTSGTRATVKATILSTSEMSEDVLAAARAAKSLRYDPNGTEAVQKKADFLSRNIGRGK